MDPHSRTDGSGQPLTSRGAFLRATAVVGAVATSIVVLPLVLWLFEQALIVHELLGPAREGIFETVRTLATATETVTYVVLPTVAILFAGYLSASRDFPALPAAAGVFAGTLVAPVGHVFLDVAIYGGQPLLGTESFATFAGWTTMLVAPAILAVFVGAVLDDLWERSAGARGVES